MTSAEQKVTEIISDYYTKTVAKFGANPKGVDWKNSRQMNDRFEAFYELFPSETASVLDVGCGYGAMAAFLRKKKFKGKYMGLDVVPEMIALAKKKHPKEKFIVGDVLKSKLPFKPDVIVCCGILTQKLSANTDDMIIYSRGLLKHMHQVSKKGVIVNMLSNRVDFESEGNFYNAPEKWLSEGLALSRRVKLHHTTDFFEFLLGVYKK